MRPRPAAAAVLTLAALAPQAWAAFTRDRIALLVSDQSGDAAAAGEVTGAVAQILSTKGYDVVPPADVQAALEQLRITGADDLTAESAIELGGALKAQAVIAVTISFVLDSRPRPRGPTASAAFGLRARMFRDGKVWRNALGWIADDAPQMQMAMSRKLAPQRPTARACERLLWSMPRGRRDPAVVEAAVAVEEPKKPPVSTRYEAEPERTRGPRGVARFPLRLDRGKR